MWQTETETIMLDLHVNCFSLALLHLLQLLPPSLHCLNFIQIVEPRGVSAARLDNAQQPGEKWALFTLDCECVASICVAGSNPIMLWRLVLHKHTCFLCHDCLCLVRLTFSVAFVEEARLQRHHQAAAGELVLVMNYCTERLVASCSGTLGQCRCVKALQLALAVQAQLGSGPSPAGSWSAQAKPPPLSTLDSHTL